MIIPAPGAAGPTAAGATYYVGAILRYRAAGVENEVVVEPDDILVKSMPALTLGYFLMSDRVFRRITDLSAEPMEIAGHPGVLIRMPPSRFVPCASYALLVLHTDAARYQSWMKSTLERAGHLGDAFPGQATPGSPGMGIASPEPYPACEASVFTLDRTDVDPGEPEEMGIVCQVRPEGSRGNLGIRFAPDVKQFLDVVERVLKSEDEMGPGTRSQRACGGISVLRWVSDWKEPRDLVCYP